MEAWQYVLLTVFVLLPFALLLGFWPDRDRLTARGAPVERDWIRQVGHPPHDDERH